MSEAYNIRKLGGDKIALLGLFAVSLITARLVVGLRSTLILSEPIQLQLAGLSISVPTGNGWQRQEGWATDGSSFILSSRFSSVPGHETAGVICMYRSVRGMATPTTRFEQRARKYNGLIVEVKQTMTNSLIFEWARIKGEEARVTVFLATTSLPGNRKASLIPLPSGSGWSVSMNSPPAPSVVAVSQQSPASERYSTRTRTVRRR